MKYTAIEKRTLIVSVETANGHPSEKAGLVDTKSLIGRWLKKTRVETLRRHFDVSYGMPKVVFAISQTNKGQMKRRPRKTSDIQ